MNRRIMILGAAALVAAVGGAQRAPAAVPEMRSGPQPGERPLPFTSNAVTGPNRGQQHCYICGLKDEPAVLVFVRHLDDPTGRLLRDLRDAVRARQKERLFAWMVVLGEAQSESALERAAFDFARSQSASNFPITVLGDPQGPPGYRIAPDADVTLLFFRSGKVLANRAYRTDEWGNKAAGAALKDLDRLFESR